MNLSYFAHFGLVAALGSLAAPPIVQAEEAPQVEVHCGVVYSIFNRPTYGVWTQQVNTAMGSADWNRIMCLLYAPFVVVKNNTGWPLELKGGRTGQNPFVTFDQPPLQLELKRIGNSHAGFVTTSPVELKKMYVNGSAGNPKTYQIALYDGSQAPLGFRTLAPGETCVFTPYLPPSYFEEVLDWQNNLTSQLKATAGWKGPSNGFCADYLTGHAPIDSAVNANLVAVPTRSQDYWDVRISGIEAANGMGTRVFRHGWPQGPAWPIDPNPDLEITQSPYSLTDHRSPIPATSMSVGSSERSRDWVVAPIFSVLLPPASQTGFITDANRNGMNDGWEKYYFGTITPSPVADDDHDGFSNYFEYLAGTSPLDGSDFIRQSLVESEAGELHIEWTSIPNRTYVVETTTNLSDWTQLAPMTANSSRSSQQLDLPESGPFFARIRIVPPIQTVAFR